MSDLVSRQALIDYLVINMAWYDEEGREVDGAEKLRDITDLLSGVPSVEPKVLACGEGELTEPGYNSDGYSKRLWKAGYKWGKAETEHKKDLIQKFHDYQVEWLTAHSDLELEPELKMLIVRFLHDTANCFMLEVDHE